ncbi:MAG: DUF3489 domain-containing protein [Planctomycetota bacterium]
MTETISKPRPRNMRRKAVPEPIEVTQPVPVQPAPTKIAGVLDMLRRDGGVTLDALTSATGWLPHTTRAALTGLRKKGHVILRTRRDDASFYSVREGIRA